MSDHQAYQATSAEIKESKRKCWNPSCKKTAWLKDCYGWNWCFYHAYYNARWSGGSFWYDIKKLKFRWPY